MSEVIVIVESRADWQIATELANRVLVETIDWLEEENLQYMFQWSGLEEGTEYSCWKDIKKIMRDVRPPKFKLGFLGQTRDGKKFKPDGVAAMKVLKLVRFLQKTRDIQAVFLIRDLDNQPDRRKGLEQARQEHCDRQPQLEVILGTADPKREAWVLNGFIPENPQEAQILTEITTQLAFDPCTEAHKLRSTAKEGSDRYRNPKIILEQIIGKNEEREQQCWRNTDLAILRDRGVETYLTTYLNEIEQRFALLFRNKILT
ncbi:MAG: hypothetical protein J7647_16170 [Cyanobacteria bacterium SBLK]|nr:hypothetical protein [Cyanobacteria bacterium SBLK]